MRRPRRGLLAAAIAASIAGCGGDGAATTVEPAALDADVLAGAATTVDGATVELADYAGADLVVWFWAPW